MDATYRSDLREINELNFARFDARMEQRITQVEARIDRVAADLRAELRHEFETRFRGLDGTLRGLDGTLRGFDGTLHRELREQTRFIVGIMTALWTALLIPIVGLWMR